MDYEIEPGMPAVSRVIELAGVIPNAATADRCYGQSSVDTEPEALGGSRTPPALAPGAKKGR